MCWFWPNYGSFTATTNDSNQSYNANIKCHDQKRLAHAKLI